MKIYRDVIFMGEEGNFILQNFIIKLKRFKIIYNLIIYLSFISEEEIKEHVLSTVGESLRKNTSKMDVLEMRAVLSKVCGPINTTSLILLPYIVYMSLSNY